MNWKKKKQEAPENINTQMEPAAETHTTARKKNVFNSRKLKYGGIATVITVLFIVVVIVINMIMSVLDSKVVLEADLTSNQAYGLTEDSIEFLNGLDKDVEIDILNTKESFESGGQYYTQAASIIENYSKHSSRVTVNYIDLIKNPTYAAEYEDEDISTNDVLVRCGDKHKLVKSSDLFNTEIDYNTFSYVMTSSKAEQSITSALVNVTSDEIPKVALLTGYDEMDASGLTSLLTSNNFEVEEVNVVTDEIPEDAKLAVIYGPSRDYTQESLKKLDEFLSNGEQQGKSLVYIAAPVGNEFPELNAFLAEWGLKVESGVTFDTDQNYLFQNGNAFFSKVDYVDEDYSSVINNQDIPVVIYNSKPITVLNDSESISVLLQTSEQSGIYPVLEEGEEWQPTEEDLIGSIPAAVVSERRISGVDEVSNVSVIGSALAFDSSFLSSTAYNNSAYFINIFNVLAEREDTVTIEAKTLGGTTMNITLNTSIPLMVIFTIVLPVLILATGLVIWIRRRNR